MRETHRGDRDFTGVENLIRELDLRLKSLESLSRTLTRSNPNVKATKNGERPESVGGVTSQNVGPDLVFLQWDETLTKDILRYHVEWANGEGFDPNTHTVRSGATTNCHYHINTIASSDTLYYRVRIETVDSLFGAWSRRGSIYTLPQYAYREMLWVTDDYGV